MKILSVNDRITEVLGVNIVLLSSRTLYRNILSAYNKLDSINVLKIQDSNQLSETVAKYRDLTNTPQLVYGYNTSIDDFINLYKIIETLNAVNKILEDFKIAEQDGTNLTMDRQHFNENHRDNFLNQYHPTDVTAYASAFKEKYNEEV